ncbi:hypothetical protein W97_07180 [Coniosporium apollinis CBS 100218]|uniref:Benzoate 4-monooxygenase cytochrome P450 n=1 Tax=Coniosporium apollinis (strain CBS 100218) TaxID=1168221 RepID=R7Z1K4_CONA1|nr:uncharacterized protein W97_07180 [Coniosporium apollinis CBS 100218]EON68032.1 hypothetical protein W97_07180 [Coniosporium apollinis CBS 100218]
MDPAIFGGGVTVTGAVQITNAINDDHRRLRQRFMQALNGRAVASQEHILQHYAAQFIEGIRKELKSSGGTVDIAKWFSLATFDVIADLAFGRPFGNLERGELHSWVAVVFGAFKALPFLRVIRELPGMLFIGSHASFLLPRKLKQMWRDHFNYAFSLIDERLKNPKERKDFVYYLIHDDGEGLTHDEIKECAAQMVMAGSEPTATFLSGLCYFLTRNQAVYEKVKEEIRTVFHCEEEMTLINLSQLKYFHAVVREGLRMFPPAADIFPRIIPEGGETILGKYLPEGTRVGIAALAASYSKSNFDNPDVFDPSRWLGDDEFKDKRMRASQPFGQGHRSCLGKVLATAEIRLLLANLLWHFEIELAPGQENWLSNCRTFLGWEKPPLMLQMTLQQAF